MEYKRISVRIVKPLFQMVNLIAKKKGMSVNAVITDMAWDFVEEWKKKSERQNT